ncbi:MAG: hypothetical protein ACPGVB_00775 [Chitinophagales bacterium]
MENTINPKKVIDFLLTRNWEIGEEYGEYYKMIPAKELGFGEESRLMFPANKKVVDYERHLISMLGENGVAGYYNMNPKNLQLALRNNSTILTLSFKSDFFEAKSIAILHFTNILQQLQNLIQQTVAWILKENEATDEEKAQYVGMYIARCNLVKMDIDQLQFKMELPSEGEWTLTNEKKIPLISIADTFHNSLQKQWKIENKSENESVEIPVQQMRLLFGIQDFIESEKLTYAHFSFFNTDWETEKEVAFGVKNEEEQGVTEEKEMAT